jgi:hypothetical protein
MLTNKQLSELIKKEVSFIAAEILLFGGDTIEPEDATPETYKWMRDERVQTRTDRLYWLAKKFPTEYSRACWKLVRSKPARPEDGPAKTGKKIRIYE